MSELGAAIKIARLGAGLTARELGRMVGLSHSYISQLESGTIRIPSPAVLKKLAAALPMLDYRRLLVLAGYLSTVDEFGPADSAAGGAVSRLSGESGAYSAAPGPSLVPPSDPEAAARVLSAVQSAAGADSDLQPAAFRAVKVRRIPLLGAIPAGYGPVTAVADADGFPAVELPSGVSGRGPFAALVVRGDSMSGAGILDGDTAVIDRGAEIRDGDICAVSVEGEDPTLKRVLFESDAVVLEPANPAFRPLVVRRGDLGRTVHLIGRLVHVARRY
ncbi:MAG: helix-turn-helix domain-containing protein [bacterium]|jgi:repressor LexA